MSSQPSEPSEAQPDGRKGWARWRKIMLIGSLVLLATSVARAVLKDDMPNAVSVMGYAVGFVLLVYGYGTFFRDR